MLLAQLAQLELTEVQTVQTPLSRKASLVQLVWTVELVQFTAYEFMLEQRLQNPLLTYEPAIQPVALVALIQVVSLPLIVLHAIQVDPER